MLSALRCGSADWRGRGSGRGRGLWGEAEDGEPGRWWEREWAQRRVGCDGRRGEVLEGREDM